ncbi:unnamed protein product [Tetraodon nigroviridis]|uniref:(spotted green pufferfish) hypothetical protein n=1 Tax=Tetraodon nigroviridis TaxID=99883 RepID=Q4T7Z9_TETNG|nr:unnamed protein product [Tetraodon nigroviridis]
MSVDSENSFLLPTPQDLRTSCVFQATEEQDEGPGGAEESLPAADFRRSTYSEPADCDTIFRSSDFLTLVKEMPSLATPPVPLLSSTPSSTAPGLGTSTTDSPGGVNIRKRRRLAASPGGLRWNSAGRRADVCWGTSDFEEDRFNRRATFAGGRQRATPPETVEALGQRLQEGVQRPGCPDPVLREASQPGFLSYQSETTLMGSQRQFEPELRSKEQLETFHSMEEKVRGFGGVCSLLEMIL